MQKLVTIYLDTQAYREGKWLSFATEDKHGVVEEPLADDLRDGWRIVSVTGFGGGGGHAVGVRGWLAVVLEK